MSEFDSVKCAKKTISVQIKGLHELEDSIGDEFSAAVDAIADTKGKVVVTGIGKSGHVGRKIAATLASTGTPAFFVHPAEASHGDLGMLTQDDLVIAISKSGESKELSDIIVYCKRFGITLIGMAMRQNSTLIKEADIKLVMPESEEACALSFVPTTSTTVTMVLGDALASALLEKKGFSQDQFKDRHPGGKLGQTLIRVSDLMHTGDAVPLVEIGASMSATLNEIANKKQGCVGIINDKGELEGIITDGDLKRKISNNFLDRAITEVMTANPKTITKDLLAGEALSLMNKMSITNIFVVEDKKPIGVIHIHDCLKAGIY